MNDQSSTPALQHSSTPILSLIHDVAALLASAGRDEAKLKAEMLVADVLEAGRLDLYARDDLEPTAEQLRRIEALAARAAAGEPLQYVLGTSPFHGRVFGVDRRALIPRPETEELVDAVLGCADLWREAQPVIADVGTGTGCIALTVVAERPSARVIGVDVSAEALALARENAERLGLSGRVDWRQGDLLAGFAPAALDAVVSNAPYVCRGEIENLAPEIRDHEPRLALDGGVDGLEIIRRLIDEAFVTLRPGGRLFLETGDGQSEAVRNHLARRGYVQASTRRDLAGHDRMTWGVRP